MDAALEADVVWGVDEDAEVVEATELVVVEGENAFDEDDVAGGDGQGLVGDSGVVGEVVDRGRDVVAGGEGLDVRGEEGVFEGVGVVEVAGGALFLAQVG